MKEPAKPKLPYPKQSKMQLKCTDDPHPDIRYHQEQRQNLLLLITRETENSNIIRNEFSNSDPFELCG